MANLFAKAKTNAVVTKTTKKSDKPEVRVTTEFFMAKGYKRAEAIERANEFNEQLAQWADLKQQEANIKAQAAVIEAEVKALGREAFISMFTETGKRPDNFLIVTDGASAQFIAQDNYLKLNETQAEELGGNYGEGIVEESTVFNFNAELVNEFGGPISEMIEKSKLPQRVKDGLIIAQTTYKVAKGTIDKLNQYGDVAEVYNAVQPIVQVKDVKRLD
jgi:hypothetical protein